MVAVRRLLCNLQQDRHGGGIGIMKSFGNHHLAISLHRRPARLGDQPLALFDAKHASRGRNDLHVRVDKSRRKRAVTTRIGWIGCGEQLAGEHRGGNLLAGARRPEEQVCVNRVCGCSAKTPDHVGLSDHR